MEVIRKLGERVEKEHNQFLRDSQRIEDRSTPTNGMALPNFESGVDFETLVGRSNSNIKPDMVIDSSKGWEDDVWGSIFNDTPEVSRSLSEIGTQF
jgi:SCY1-like protein 2